MSYLRKSFLSLVFLLLAVIVNAQHLDRVINVGIYKSYFCDALHDPLYVTYYLHYSKGECTNVYKFSPCGEITAISADYEGTGYDRGHLAPKEDFSATCELRQATYCYFNCLP